MLTFHYNPEQPARASAHSKRFHPRRPADGHSVRTQYGTVARKKRTDVTKAGVVTISSGSVRPIDPVAMQLRAERDLRRTSQRSA